MPMNSRRQKVLQFASISLMRAPRNLSGLSCGATWSCAPKKCSRRGRVLGEDSRMADFSVGSADA